MRLILRLGYPINVITNVAVRTMVYIIALLNFLLQYVNIVLSGRPLPIDD